MDMVSLFSKINSWEDFNKVLVPLNTKQMGDAFELLTKAYFEIDHKYNNYDNIWLLSEVPKKDLEIIGLESRDLGVDLIAKKGSEYHAIQCKYHTDKDRSVSFREVSTFLSNLGGYDKLTEGYLCSSAVSTTKNYDDVKKKPVSKILHDTWSNLDEEFFERLKKYLKKEKYSPEPYYPRPHQEKATNQAYEHFIKNKEPRGKLIFPCGAGKSLTGFWMMEKLDAMSTVIAVPSLSLVKQTLDVYLKEIVARDIKVNWLCICSDEGIGSNTEIKFKTEDIGVPCKTDPAYIKAWMKEHKNSRNVIFTTYQSSRLIADISKELNHTFDLGILDEAHKTVGGNDKLFSYLLFEKNIAIKSRIFMTATERFYSGSKDDIVSMDDFEVYGDIFAQMSFKEAIDLKLLTDYKIITIDVKKSEIADFIKDNGLVESNDVWKKETEARSLASMLALRKAMQQFPIKNAVSFHSSIAKAIRSQKIQKEITDDYDYEPIDTYTVSGKDKTSKRNDIIQEFASSEKALITNARCLTEGVDVPNIDCIVFADPRKSKVDIVQALGRALRKKEGKDWGYVILPVIYDGSTNEIDNENFNEILSIVRGLAANDERIIDYFKDKSLPKGGQKGGGAEIFSMISETLSESDFAEQLNIRIWNKLSRFKWASFKLASDFTRKLGLKSINEWRLYAKSNKRPYYIPYHPERNYSEFEKLGGYNYWLNIKTLSNWDKSDNFFTYNEAKFFLKEECRGVVNSMGTFHKWAKGQFKTLPKMPKKMPKKPWGAYENEWISTYDFFGTKQKKVKKGTYPHKNFKKISYSELKMICQENNLQTRLECRNWLFDNKDFFNKKGFYAPLKGGESYKEFEGWAKFLNSKNSRVLAHRKNKVIFSYNEAKMFLKELNLKSKTEFYNYIKGMYKSKKEVSVNLPRAPRNYYLEKGWNGWADFLGKE